MRDKCPTCEAYRVALSRKGGVLRELKVDYKDNSAVLAECGSDLVKWEKCEAVPSWKRFRFSCMLEDLTTLERHKSDVLRPQRAHKDGITATQARWDDGTREMQVTLDFMSSATMGHGPREQSGEYYKYSHCTVLGFHVYLPGKAGKLRFLLISMNQHHTAEAPHIASPSHPHQQMQTEGERRVNRIAGYSIVASGSTKAPLEVAAFGLNKVLEYLRDHAELGPLFAKVRRLRVFADCGKHFRAHVFAHYVLIEAIKKFCNLTESELNFFLEDHGKTDLDGFFSAVLTYLTQFAKKERIATLVEVEKAFRDGHKDAQERRQTERGYVQSTLVVLKYGIITGCGLAYKRLEVACIMNTYSLTTAMLHGKVEMRDRVFPDVPFGKGAVVAVKEKPSTKTLEELEPRWARLVEDVPMQRYDALRDRQWKQDMALVRAGSWRSAPISVIPETHFEELLVLCRETMPTDLKLRKARAATFAREPGRRIGYWSDGAKSYRFAVLRGVVKLESRKRTAGTSPIYAEEEVWIEYEDASGLGTIATELRVIVQRACRKTKGLKFIAEPDGKAFEFEGGDRTMVQCTSCAAWRYYDDPVDPCEKWVCPLGCNVFSLTTEELQFAPEQLPQKEKKKRCTR